MSTHRETNDALLISLLLNGRGVAEAAREAGVSAKTVSRRLQNPTFCASLDRERRELLAMVANELAACSSAAARTLRELLDSRQDSIRLRAARSIIELGTRFLDAYELDARVARLEAANG